MRHLHCRTRKDIEMDMHACTEVLRQKVGADSGLGATLKFDCGDAGIAYIDGKSTPNTVDNADRDADCTVAITLENFAALLTGELEPATGFMMGKFKVSGDMSVALKLQRVV
jgi:putative sterol carrier protein